ncbi:fructose 1,6-bisphosphatase [Candidatus Woesearchaeota archaeon]|nr:fructose 1,6-bisphosphatase [Candidatus Woesearchaeota archaeon]
MNEKQYTISAIKADVGSIGGHTRPSLEMLSTADQLLDTARRNKVIIDYRVMHTGDDICLLMTHRSGKNAPDIHNIALEAFFEATDIARAQGLYAAGQDLKVDSPCGNVRGAGPGAAELNVTVTDARPSEQILLFAADKTSPGAYNLPLFNLAIPTFNDAALLSKLSEGLEFEIMDMEFKHENKTMRRTARLAMPEALYDIAVLLKNPNRYAVSSIRLRKDADCGNEFVSASTDRLHNITGKYEGKDDPVLLVRAQKQFPAAEEIIQQFITAHLVPGGARGSHMGPLLPVRMNLYHNRTYQKSPSMEPFCCPIVSCAGFSIKDGIISSAVDHFDSYLFEEARRTAFRKFMDIRQNGFVEPGMLPDLEVEYVDGYQANLKKAERAFESRTF